MSLLTRLTKLFMKKPIKIILISILAIIFFVFGAQSVRMATGNDTLVSRNSQVFQDNLELEEEFGGESIVVIYEDENLNNLLTIANLNHIKLLENSLKAHRKVYSIISPVTLVEQMSQMQSDRYKEGIADLVIGLDEMGTKLIEIGENIQANSSQENQMKLPDFDEKMQELARGLATMIQGQEKLKEGIFNLQNGYMQFGNQTKEIAVNMQTLASQLENTSQDPNQQKQIKELSQISQQLIHLSDKIIQNSQSTSSLPVVPDQTVKGLKGIENGLSSQKSSLGELAQKQESQTKDLRELGNGLVEMGKNLVMISDNLNIMLSYSDSFAPSLPQNQETLNYMIYDEENKLRDIFNEVVLDGKYMMMMIKLQGNMEDTTKSEIVSSIKTYLEDHTLPSTKAMVSGKPVLDDAIRSNMKESMKKMMMLSVVFMITVLSVVFKVRWRLLPLAIILLAVLGTIGIMGWVNIPVTMVSMAVFPILIGLGIDYAIQFQNRYEEELQQRRDF